MLTSVYAEQPEHSVRYSNVCVTEQQDHKQNCIAGGVGGGVDSFWYNSDILWALTKMLLQQNAFNTPTTQSSVASLKNKA